MLILSVYFLARMWIFIGYYSLS